MVIGGEEQSRVVAGETKACSHRAVREAETNVACMVVREESIEKALSFNAFVTNMHGIM